MSLFRVTSLPSKTSILLSTDEIMRIVDATKRKGSRVFFYGGEYMDIQESTKELLKNLEDET